MNALSAYWSDSGFIPHGFCLLWRPDVLALHVISDLIIAGSYFSIPLAILWFVQRRKDPIAEHKRIAILFSVFILGCGLTHVVGVIVLWRPIYVIDGWLKAFTALVSILTAAALWPVLPRLLRVPSPKQLEAANAQLQQEIAARREALAELEAIRSGLETEVSRRTAEVEVLARRFEIATAGSVITMMEQDAQLRYTWMHNPRLTTPGAALGRTDEEVLGRRAAATLAPLKRKVMQSGESLRTEVALQAQGSTHYFDLQLTPIELTDGAPGLLTVSIEVTEQRRQQEHLQVIMRELAHRAKNLLSLVEGIARQTLKAEGLPTAFVDRFSDRLGALGSAYDLLISKDWKGVDLAALIDTQLAHIVADNRARVLVEGPPTEIRPEAGQYLALALHELATNATKYGVLSRSEGTLEIRWRLRTDAEGAPRLDISWTEVGAVATPPTRSGFGRRLLELIIPRALQGESSLEFTDRGVCWQMSFAQ